MASSYKYCRYCGSRKRKRWGLKTIYYCSECGHRTCSRHFAQGDICLQCAEDHRRKAQRAEQERVYINQVSQRVQSWCQAHEYDHYIGGSIDHIRSGLSLAHQSISHQYTQRANQAQDQWQSYQSQLNRLNELLTHISKSDMTLHKIKQRIQSMPECSSRTRLLALVNKPMAEGLPKVVVFGPMNHGKSSLLNVLVEKPEYFKVADARQTTSIKELKYNGVIYRDVPGWDAAAGADNDEMLRGLESCDTWLYNHDIGVGELNVMDLRCLSAFVERIANRTMCAQSLIICLSKVDKKTPSEVTEIKKQIERQLKSLKLKSSQGLAYKCIVEISTKRFDIAMTPGASDKKRQKFLQLSGISTLSDHIKEALRHRKTNAALQRIQELETALKATIRTQKSKKGKAKTKLNKAQQQLQQLESSYQTLRNSL